MRQRLSLEQQQMLVEHTQAISHLFRRPRTAGGGQYHIYCVRHPSSSLWLSPRAKAARCPHKHEQACICACEHIILC